MTSLADRLSKVQVKVETPLPDISKHTMEELGEMTIQFGNTHVGKKFKTMWTDEQPWITWFVKHYPRSEKLDHRLVLRYVELKIAEAENWNHKVPVKASTKDSQTSQQIKKMGGYAKAKAKLPARKATKADMDPETLAEIEQWEALEAMGLEEEESWDLQEVLLREGEPTRQECLEADVQSLQTRLLNMENMLQQVVSHIQATASESANTPK